MKHAYRSTIFGLLLMGMATLLAGCNFSVSASTNTTARASPQPVSREAPEEQMTISTHPDCIDPLGKVEELKDHCSSASLASASVPASLFVAHPAGTGLKGCDADKSCADAKVYVTGNGAACQAALIYRQINVSGSDNGKRLAWTLVAPAGYEFDGAGGIAFVLPSANAPQPDPKKWWEVDPKGSSGTVASMKMLGKPSSDSKLRPRFCHYPRVRHIESKTLCCPIDPIIINDP